MTNRQDRLPPRPVMIQAMQERDAAFDGVFFTAVKTTGIFCRPTCPARKPLPENVVFYAQADDAMTAGFRPCLRCKPLQVDGAPDWIRPLLDAVDVEPERRWTDESIDAFGCNPVRVRRWFINRFGMTFHAFHRARRLGMALDRLQSGETVDAAALDHGYESVSGFRSAFRKTFDTTPGKADSHEPLTFDRIDTPLGPMIAMAEEKGLVLLEFIDRPAVISEVEELKTRYGYTVSPGRNAHIEQVETQLREYFDGRRSAFDVPLVTPGSTFDRAVWDALREIPPGHTISYGELANRLGKPGASRAVGAANGHNRIAIVIPCHRVIGADGKLTGYGGGQHRKQWLIDHEQKMTGTRIQAELALSHH